VNERSNRNKVSLHLFWLKDESLEEFDNLPDLDVLAEEIIADPEAQTIPVTLRAAVSLPRCRDSVQDVLLSYFYVTQGCSSFDTGCSMRQRTTFTITWFDLRS